MSKKQKENTKHENLLAIATATDAAVAFFPSNFIIIIAMY